MEPSDIIKDKKRVKNRSLRKLLLMMIIAIIIFFVLVFVEDYSKKVTAGITANRQKVKTEAGLKSKIEKYNDALIKAYKNNSSDLMKDLTTEDELERVRLYMTYNYFEKSRKLNTKLVDLSFKDINVKEEEATIETEEEWTYFYTDVETENKLSEKKEIYYRAKYTLIKQDDNWLIDSISIEKTSSDK